MSHDCRTCPHCAEGLCRQCPDHAPLPRWEQIVIDWLAGDDKERTVAMPPPFKEAT